MKRQTANIVTLLRVFLAVWAGFLLWSGYENNVVILAIISLAAVSDIVDGRLARFLNSVTQFGRSLDRMADKILVFPFFLNFLVMVFFYQNSALANLIKAELFLILIIELGLIFVWTYAVSQDLDAGSHHDGKVKQVFYMAALCLWFLFRVIEDRYGYRSVGLEESAMAIAFFFSVCYAFGSLTGYIDRYWPSSSVTQK